MSFYCDTFILILKSLKLFRVEFHSKTELVYLLDLIVIFRLKEVADRINRLGHNLHPTLSNLPFGIKKICLASTYIALLLEDGRVCRVSYNILPDRLDLSKNDSKR